MKPFAGGDPSHLDLDAAESLDRNETSRLDLVRGRAEKWAGGLTALTGLVGTVLVGKAPENMRGISTPWRIAVSVLLAAALASLVLGTYRAYRAAYGDPGRLDEIRPMSVFAPLGLIHADHLAVSEACFRLAVNSPFTWYVYLDLPYGLGNRRALSRRIAAVRRYFQLVDLDSFDGDPEIKQRAMSFYRSQYATTRHNHRKAFDATMRGGERYWRMEPLP